MSAKIYDGYRVWTRTIGALNSALADFRGRVTPVAQSEYNVAFGKRAALYADAKIAGVPITRTRGRNKDQHEDATETPASSAWQDFWDADRDIRITRQRNPEYDFQCELSVYPGSPWTLVYFMAEPSRSYDEVWLATPGVKPFPYWNNTDRPADMTQRQWDRRGQQWEARLERTPLVWSLYHEYGGPNPPRGDDLVNCMPPKPDRLNHLARHIVLSRPDPDWVREAVDKDHYSAIWKWVASDQFKDMIDTEILRLESILPDRLELGDLVPHLRKDTVQV